MTIGLLPSNATPLERATVQMLAEFLAPDVPLATLWLPASCPIAVLPYLAWALSVDEWDPLWSEDRQREVVAAAVLIHQHKGTPWAVKRTLAVMGYGDCVITEGADTFVGGPWTVGDGMPVGGASHWAEYWVTITETITPAMAAAIARRLSSVAPARCRLTKIMVDAVSVVVGGPWAVGDEDVTVGGTYYIEETLDG